VLPNRDWASCRISHFYEPALRKELISTLLITLIIESAVVIGYSLLRKRPIQPILSTSLCVNLITQSLLWIALNVFFRHYLIALLMSEIAIWVIESFLLYFVPGNQLGFIEATLLSLSMNLASFALGWYMPA
jgi:Na+/melibiose symporter-like transporter